MKYNVSALSHTEAYKNYLEAILENDEVELVGGTEPVETSGE